MLFILETMWPYYHSKLGVVGLTNISVHYVLERFQVENFWEASSWKQIAKNVGIGYEVFMRLLIEKKSNIFPCSCNHRNLKEIFAAGQWLSSLLFGAHCWLSFFILWVNDMLHITAAVKVIQKSMKHKPIKYTLASCSNLRNGHYFGGSRISTK